MHDRYLDAEPVEAVGLRCSDEGIEGHYKFILIEEVEKWEAVGWIIVADFRGTPHGHYSVLGKWTGSGEPIMP